MRKRLIVVSSMLFLGVAAAVPKLTYRLGGLDNQILAGGDSGLQMLVRVKDQASATAYRPCRSRSDDHCIQVSERSIRMVRTPTAAPVRVAEAPRPAPARPQRRVQTASFAPPPGPPVAFASCSTLITDDCVAAFDRMRNRVPTPRPRRTGTLETPGI